MKKLKAIQSAFQEETFDSARRAESNNAFMDDHSRNSIYYQF